MMPAPPMFLLAEVMFYKVQSKYMKWHFGFITPLDSSSTSLSAVCLPHSRIPSDEGRSPIARVRTWKRTSSCQMHLVTQTGSHTNKIKTERGRRGTASCHPLARDKKVEKWSASRWKISRVAVFCFFFVLFCFEWHLILVIEFTVPSSGALPWPFFFFFLKVVRLLVFCVCGNQHTQGWKTPPVPLKKKWHEYVSSVCWNFQSKTFSWGNLARCCGQSTRVNGLVAAGFHLVAVDAAGCWWHRRWLSDMERSGVRAGLISASCAPPRSAQACIWWTSIVKKIWTGLAAPRVEGLCLLSRDLNLQLLPRRPQILKTRAHICTQTHTHTLPERI